MSASASGRELRQLLEVEADAEEGSTTYAPVSAGYTHAPMPMRTPSAACGLACRAAAVGALLAAGALLLQGGGARHGSEGASVDAGMMLASAAEETTTAAACSGDGEECTKSKCCGAGGKKGLQCFAKNDFWAQCLESCTKGAHPGETRGTWNAGKFQPETWSCNELGSRSGPSCEQIEESESCPSDRCKWSESDGACRTRCETLTDQDACGGSSSCMWKDECMQACDTFSTRDTCRPFDKCVWGGGACQEGCWTFGSDDCAKHARCTMSDGKCKEACSTFDSESDCQDHDRCMWRAGLCKVACGQYSTHATCPGTLGCMWEEEGQKCTPDPCSTPGEDCTNTQCCSPQRGSSGMTCFQKNKYYATCKSECEGDGGDWSCKALGNRSKFSPGCAWAGADCSGAKLCCNVGFSCLVRDEKFTGCVQTVKKSTWVSEKVPLPPGWQGTYVGPGRTEYKIPSAPEGQPVAGTGLYCIMAILPGSYEVDLMKLARQNGQSIFKCDKHDLFHSWKSAKEGWDTGESTLTNTDVFINVWDQVRDRKTYELFDWTVKADADAVFLPDRLKQHIRELRPPANRAMYLKNNDMDKGLGNNGFLGAVEVFSKLALMVYYDNKDDCRATLGIDAGEDGFFKGCMDALGVGFMVDAHMFFPDISAGVCNDERRAAFHPLKKLVDWQCCLDIVNGKMHAVTYGNCDLGYEVKIREEEQEEE